MATPNRARSLIGAFAMNPAQFHRADGAGYRIVGDAVRAVATSNPQLASRLAGRFDQWRRYDDARGTLMTNELRSIRDSQPARDVLKLSSVHLEMLGNERALRTLVAPTSSPVWSLIAGMCVCGLALLTGCGGLS